MDKEIEASILKIRKEIIIHYV